jgi:hypothetical protein
MKHIRHVSHNVEVKIEGGMDSQYETMCRNGLLIQVDYENIYYMLIKICLLLGIEHYFK